MRLGSSQIDYIVPAVKKEINPRITIQPVTQANSKLPLRLGNTKNGRREGACPRKSARGMGKETLLEN